MVRHSCERARGACEFEICMYKDMIRNEEDKGIRDQS